MRIVRLDLIAFGPFSGARLEFGSPPGVVELVYGRNEAGKSTTLRAVSGLLFGIPERTRDAHRHAPAELRIGAVLETAAGERLEVVRRRGRKNTLRAADDTAFDESVLSKLLLGATEELFEGLFGLDHERLRASAQALLAGEGNVGESLFAAGVGGRGVHELSAALAREACELFTPRARERKISRAIVSVKEARDAVRQAATSPTKYLEQQRALEAAIRRKETLRARRTALATEQAELTRVVTALPGLRRRAVLLGRLEALGEVADLPPDAAARRVQAERELADARREGARLAEQENETRAMAAAVVVNEALLDVDESLLINLRARRGRYLSAELDRPKLEAKATAIEASVRRSLTSIGAVSDVSGLHLSVAANARLRTLAARRQRLEQALENVRRQLEAVRTRRMELTNRLIGPVPADARERASAVIAGKASALPTVQRVDHFATRRAALDGELEQTLRERRRVLQQSRDVEKRLDALRRLGEVPTEMELQASRLRRDREFLELRTAASDESERLPSLLDACASLVVAADTLADRLRREADRVALWSTLEAEKAALASELRDGETSLASVRSRLAALDRDWCAAFVEFGVEPRPPAEMRGWAGDLEALWALEPELERLEGDMATARADLQAWQASWRDAVQVLGLAGEPTEEEAFAVLDAMTQLVRQVEEVEGLRRRLDGIERDSEAFASEVAACTRKYLPPADRLSPAEAADRFVRAAEEARAMKRERARLDREIASISRAWVEQAERQQDAKARLSAHVHLAKVENPSQLEDAERRSSEARSLREQLRGVDAEIIGAGDGATLAELEAQTMGRDLDFSRARLREIEGELEELNDQMGVAGQDVGHLEHGMHSMEHTDATEAAAVLADRVAALKRHVHRYARLRLASAVLDRKSSATAKQIKARSSLGPTSCSHA